MDFGKKINELRKSKNVTQDEMAAELGVTAAAVSKWENGYTLPDILMLCALADYFNVTTDELLGRNTEKKYAVIAAETSQLCKKIEEIANQYGIITKLACTDCQEALAAVRADDQITHLLIGLERSNISEMQFDWGTRPISFYLSLSDTEQGILDDLRNSLQNNR